MAVAVADPGVAQVVTEAPALEASAAGVLADADAAMAAGRFDEAARALEAVAAVSGDARVHSAAALARYEGGWPRRALSHVQRSLALSPEDAAALSLAALVLADLGRATDALARLDHADRLLAEHPDSAVAARVAVNRALVLADQGREVEPEAALGEAIRTGHIDEARRLATAAPTGGRREAVNALIGRAAVERAEGKLAEATATSWEALGRAREAGMVREVAHALLSLATTSGLAGQASAGQAQAEEAIGVLEGTEFEVLRVAAELEAGRLAARAGAMEAAQLHLAAAHRDPPLRSGLPLQAREEELRGLVAALTGHADPARDAFEAAMTRYDALGYGLDGARVAVARVEAEAQANEKRGLHQARTDALARFERLSDPLGPAHVAIAEGLGHARAKRLEQALDAFALAATSAEQQPGGERIAAIAREDAAQALLALGDATGDAHADLAGAVIAHRELVAARAAYDQGVASYGAGDFAAARTAFDGALRDLLAVGDAEGARLARSGRAWATWNLAVGLEPAASMPIYEELVGEADEVGDAELQTRALAASLLARAALGEPTSLDRLQEVALRAESERLNTVAAQCLAAVADQHPDLRARAAAARAAAALDSSTPVGGYALYGVAVAAYNQDDMTLAVALAEEALPLAGSLEPAVREVLDAARAALR